MMALFSTAYFPPVRYVATLLQHTHVMVEAKETFPKQTYRNRMEILTAGGVRRLSVPVVRRNHSRTDEVRIDYKERWNIVHLRTIEAAYSASPYFQYYRDDIDSILVPHHDLLIDLNQTILRWLLKCLKTDIEVELTSEYADMPVDNDYRTAFSPKQSSSHSALPPYYQVFSDRQPFAGNLSVLDLMMNLGPDAKAFLNRI